jgi:hypothetical protein
MKRTPVVLASLTLMAFGSAAGAEEQKPAPAPIEIRVKIRSRVPRPAAAIDIARAEPKLGVADLRKPAADRIEQVIAKEPF